MKIDNIRKEYTKSKLNLSLLDANPFMQFEKWMKEAVEYIQEPTAFVLGTATENGLPSTRVVLLKSFTPEGFTFFTNYNSRKGQQLASNPVASMTFFWPELERQIHIEGSVVKSPQIESEDYFKSRPYESQIGATLSKQSSPLDSKADLVSSFLDLLNKDGFKPEKPESWGGYCIKPSRIEFWQGGEHRLHDRFCYEFNGSSWSITQLNP